MITGAHVLLYTPDPDADRGFFRDVLGFSSVDAGRGWLVGDRVGDLQYPKDQLPGLSTFKTDIGVGFDAGLIGLFVAKSVSDSKEPPNFFVRVGKRF